MQTILRLSQFLITLLVCFTSFALGFQSDTLITQVFYKTSKNKLDVIKGSEDLLVYISPFGILYCSKYYYVVETNSEDAAPHTQIFRRRSQFIEDSIAIANNDSVLFHTTDSDEFFYGLQQHFLFIDAGTYVGVRGLVVYDLTKGDKVFSTDYSDQPENPFLDSAFSVVFWEPVGPADSSNCSEFNNILKDELVPNIAKKCSFHLLKKLKTQLGETRCVEFDYKYHKL